MDYMNSSIEQIEIACDLYFAEYCSLYLTGDVGTRNDERSCLNETIIET